MADTLTFYFDFGSPYGYFAAHLIDEVAAEHGVTARWQPFLMWVVVEKSGLAQPMAAPVRRDYMLDDMARSAAYYGLSYQEPPKLGATSTHLAARLFHDLAAEDAALAKSIAQRILHGYHAEGRDISDRDTLLAMAEEAGLAADKAAAAIEGDRGPAALEKAIEDAVADGVIGSPFFVVDDQRFFGVDRLPQIAWHLERKTT